MPTRKAEATWQGDLESGKGSMKTQTGAVDKPFSFGTRFKGEQGTNPEELIAAAHAGCFSMAFSHMLSEEGFVPDEVHTTAEVTLDKVGDGFAITTIALKTRGKVPGIDAAQFNEIAEQAKAGCPVSKALAGPEITLDAKLD